MRGNRPVVSVMMGVYNGVRRLRETADSVLSQTFPDFEFIIIDDGSSDNISKEIGGYADSRIVFSRSPVNRGLTASLLEAARLSRGGLLARIDCGDVCSPRRFERQIEFFRAHREAALVGSDYEVIDGNGRRLRVSDVPAGSGDIRRRLSVNNCFGHSTVMMRRECFEAVGGYRREFRFSQDYDLYLRLVERYDLANLKEPLVKWRLEKHSCGVRHAAEQAFYASLARECALARKKGEKEPLGDLPPADMQERPAAAFARYWLELARSRPKAREALPCFFRSLRSAPLLADNYRFLWNYLKGKLKCW